MFGLEKRRWERLRAESFPLEWLRVLERNVPFYRQLPEADQRELQGHVQVIIAEKNFEGCGGLEMTDEIRVTIAAHAALLLLHRETEYYPRLRSVVVYPAAFIVNHTEVVEEGGYTVEGPEARLGESWHHGAVVLSWDDVRAGARNFHDGYNVVLHEFAHQLDLEDGSVDGVPALDDSAWYRTWRRLLEDEYRELRKAVARGEPTVLDQYGATEPAEFFAVATEAFFEKPVQLCATHPALYES
jgi:Mlc titration factor MtfA (ptsG expression regulator)